MARQIKLVCLNCSSKMNIYGGQQIESVKRIYASCPACEMRISFSITPEAITQMPREIHNLANYPQFSKKIKT